MRDRSPLLAEVSAFRPGPGGMHLTELCHRLKVGLRVNWVGLELVGGREFGWPNPLPTGAGPVHSVPLLVGSEPVGRLVVGLPVVPLGRRRRKLLADLADLLGPLLYGVSLQSELEHSLETARGHAERVAAVRRRTFVERDLERRAIERDLHDGAQHHLVALGLNLGLVELYLSRNDPEDLRKQLLRLSEGLDRAQQSLLITATEGSPLLHTAGVYEALRAEFEGSPITFDATRWDTAKRFEPAVELAVYFICLEAASNSRKHAPGAEVLVRIAETPVGLEFSVTDTGPGMRRQRLEDASGVTNMRRRIAAAGGHLQIRTAEGAGTVVQGFIPF